MCHVHGGAAPAARAAAAAREAEKAAGELLATIWKTDTGPVTNPVAALQALAGRLQHAADALGGRLGEELDQVTPATWLRVLRELRQSLERMERLDLAGKQLQLERDQARMVRPRR